MGVARVALRAVRRVLGGGLADRRSGRVARPPPASSPSRWSWASPRSCWSTSAAGRPAGGARHRCDERLLRDRGRAGHPRRGLGRDPAALARGGAGRQRQLRRRPDLDDDRADRGQRLPGDHAGQPRRQHGDAGLGHVHRLAARAALEAAQPRRARRGRAGAARHPGPRDRARPHRPRDARRARAPDLPDLHAGRRAGVPRGPRRRRAPRGARRRSRRQANDALTELRGVLGVLREDDPRPATVGAPAADVRRHRRAWSTRRGRSASTSTEPTSSTATRRCRR